MVYLDWRRYWDYGAVSYLNEHENTHDSYDDHERGDKTAYGSYFFDKDPLNREFYLKKDGDDGWIVEKAEVYIFHPASEDFLNESACNYFVNNSKQDMDSSGSGTMKITSGAFQKQPNHENCKRLHEISNKHEGSLGGLK